MNPSERILRFANKIFSTILLLVLVITGVYAGYALWDNSMVYAEAGNMQSEMLKWKPTEENGHSFEELLRINKDVVAWITMDGTEIDYPIVQGSDNMEYVNKDVYGNFALAGSIFLDSRNDRNFTDPYSILYGHYMAERKMFGDLELYKDKRFFEENRTGTLILPDRSYDLKIFAVVLVGASDNAIFHPTNWQNDIDGLLQFANEESFHLDKEMLRTLQADNGVPQVIALTTCSYEFTDARTVVLAHMIPKQ